MLYQLTESQNRSLCRLAAGAALSLNAENGAA
jgi:hypothetical protein